MESDEAKWLKRVYSEAPKEGPCAKKVKFSVVQGEIGNRFAPTSYTPYAVSQVIHEAFPNSESKAYGKLRQKYIFGIQASSTSSSDVTLLLEKEHNRNSQLQLRVQELEARVIEQAQAVSSAPTRNSLVQQMDDLLTNGCQVIHGPDTPERFQQFSIDSVIDEIRVLAPDVYKLFMELGNTDRNIPLHGGHDAEKVRAVTSVCTLLKARSVRVKGIQLLISFMLIARATSRQVSI